MVIDNTIPRESKAKSPVKLCWELFDKLKTDKGAKFSRKEAIDAAMKLGVAYYTARTQYWEWKQAGDPDVQAKRFALFKALQQKKRELEKRLPHHRI